MSVGVTGAATISVSLLGDGTEKLVDDRYNDGESMLLRTTGGAQSFTLRAVNFGEDERSSVRWGLVDASKPWNRGKEGALLQQGFAPGAIGLTTHHYLDSNGVDTALQASYLSVMIHKSTATMFTNVNVELRASSLALSSTSWAGTSANNFTSVTTTNRGTLTSQGRAASWDFANLDYTGDDPLELRFYGVLGGDSALLNSLTLQINAVPVPEAKSLLLLTTCGVWLSLHRRRRLALR